MRGLSELVLPYESVSLIGMCKNAGKTTTLNCLIREFEERGEPVAVTSIGRDGESTDLVTNTAKPGIYVYQGTVIATAADLLKYCDITKEILAATGIYTPLGEIVLLRAKSDGFVQVAGPSMAAQLAGISGLFRQFGAGRILIDGALGRKSLCTKRVSASTILCTGASYHKDIETVVRDTAFICELLRLEEAGLSPDDRLLEQTEFKYIPLYRGREPGVPEEKQEPGVLWRRGNPDAPEKILVQGGLTDAMVKPLLMGNTDLREKTLIVKDGSRILLSCDLYQKLKRRGLRFAVLDAIDLLAVTINPFSAYGYPFDPDEFYEKMSRAVAVPVYNIRA